MKPKMTQEELDRAIQLYDDGLKCSEIAIILSRNTETIRKNLKRLGISMRQYRDYYADSVDENYFEHINSEDRAYWFGFLAADACIAKSCGDYRSFRFELQRSDRQSIIEFSTAIQYSGNIHDFMHFNKKKNKHYPKSAVYFNNKEFCNNLLTKKWLEFKKNDSDALFSYIPQSLMRHFVRGFFDGDGCISRSNKKFKSHYFSFSGSENVLNAVGDIISYELGFINKRAKPSKTCKAYRIGWNGNIQVKKFGEWLYDDATIFMNRKHKRFQILNDKYNFSLPDYELDSNNNFYYPLSYQEISKLSQTKRNGLIDQFEHKIANRKWVPPSYSNEELLDDYSRLEDEQLDDYLVNDGFRSWNVSSKGFAGRKILTHFQPHYWETSYRSQKTLVQGWYDKAIRRKACEKLFNTRGARPSLARYLRELNVSGARRVSHFHPGLAKAAILYFGNDPKSVLDPCAGWGARLLACSSLQVDYTTCDPNYKTIAGLRKIADFIGFKCNINEIPFEEFDTNRKFDMIFTSPPYFSIERYKYGKQSYYDKSSYLEWYNKFLILLVEKCLTLSDTIVLHVSEKIKNSLMQSYPNSVSTPTSLQKTAGHKKSSEFFVDIKPKAIANDNR